LGSFNKRSIYKHLAEEHNRIITDPNSTHKKTTKKLGIINPPNTLPTPKRRFYVDTAYSIQGKDGKRWWKSVIVEEGKLLLEFANGKMDRESSCGAETYAILKGIYYLIEKKIGTKEKVYLYSDNLGVIRILNNQSHKDLTKINYYDRDNSFFYKYVYCIKKLVKENNLNIKFKWVKGRCNPADYYSRNNYRWWKPKSMGRRIGV